MSALTVHRLPPLADDAARIAARLNAPLRDIDLHRFPDGETRVTVGTTTATTIAYASLDQPNDKLIALMLAAEALRRGGAERLVLVAPYLCYMRQDAAFREGEAISQKVIGRLLAGTFDRVVTVDAHLHRTIDIADVFPGIVADNLSAMPAIAASLRAGFDRRTVLVGPDVESQAWVGDLAQRLGAEYLIARKVRHGDRSVSIAFDDPGRLAGRPALIVDDIVSSGGTLIAAARAIAAAGAVSVEAIITHALFAPALLDEFTRAGIRTVRSTNSVTHPTNAFPLDHILVPALMGELNDRTPA